MGLTYDILCHYLEKGIQSNKFLCPFHEDTKPSLSIKTASGGGDELYWKCFGCGATGRDGVDLVSQIRGVSQIRACQIISEEMGLPLERLRTFSSQERENAELSGYRNQFMALARAGLESDQLVRQYLEKRRIGLEVAKKAGLGAYTHTVLTKATKLVKANNLMKVGLLRSDGSPAFPVPSLLFAMTERGDIKSFSAKPVIDLPDQDLKYQAIAGESGPLWGSEAIYEASTPVYIVEGVFDALTLRQAGLAAMSLQGTDNAATAAKLLAERLQNLDVELLVMFDRDSAGEKATRVFTLTALTRGLVVGVVQPDWGERGEDEPRSDPNEYFVETGCTPEELREQVESFPVQSLDEYLLALVEKQKNRIVNVVAQYYPGSVLGRQPWIMALKKGLKLSKREAEGLLNEAKQLRGSWSSSGTADITNSTTWEGVDTADLYVKELSIEGFTPLAATFPQGPPAMGMGLKGNPSKVFYYSLPVLGVVADEKGQTTGTKLLVVTSARECFYYDNPGELINRLGILFPPDLPTVLGEPPWENTWTIDGVQQYLRGHTVDPKELFREIRKKLRSYLELESSVTGEITTLWIMGTYYFELFDAYPYLYISGEMGSGKTRLLEFLNLVAFNAVSSASATVADIARRIDVGRCVFCLDEAETLSGARRGGGEDYSQDFRLVLQAGYKRGSTISRAVKDKSKWEGSTVSYNVYSPKAFAMITAPHRVLRSRCIEVKMLRTMKKEVMRKSYSQEDKAVWDKLRDDLHIFGLDNAHKAAELVTSIEDPDIYPDWLTGRDAELWLPLLVTGKIVDPEGNLNFRIQEYARREPTATRIAQWTENVLICLLNLARATNKQVMRLTAKEIVEYYNEYYNISDDTRKKKSDNDLEHIDERRVYGFLNRFHFPRGKHSKVFRGQYEYEIAADVLRRALVSHGIMEEDSEEEFLAEMGSEDVLGDIPLLDEEG